MASPSATELAHGDRWLMLSDRQGFEHTSLAAIYDGLVSKLVREGSSTDPRVARALDDLERDVTRTFSAGVCDASPQLLNQLRRLLAALAEWDPRTGYVQVRLEMPLRVCFAFLLQPLGLLSTTAAHCHAPHPALPPMLPPFQGLNFIAAFALLHTRSEVHAWVLCSRFLYHPDYALNTLFTDGMRNLCVASEVLAALLAIHAPAVSRHLARVGVDVFLAHDWFLVMFTTTLPHALAAGVWDAFAADGSVVLMRVMVLLLQHLEPRFAGADQHATLMLLRGYARARSAAGEGLGGRDSGGASGSGVSTPTVGAVGAGAPLPEEAAVEPPADLLAALLSRQSLSITATLVSQLTRDAEAAAAKAGGAQAP